MRIPSPLATSSPDLPDDPKNTGRAQCAEPARTRTFAPLIRWQGLDWIVALEKVAGSSSVGHPNDKHVLRKSASLLPSLSKQARKTKSEQAVLGKRRLRPRSPVCD